MNRPGPISGSIDPSSARPANEAELEEPAPAPPVPPAPGAESAGVPEAAPAPAPAPVPASREGRSRDMLLGAVALAVVALAVTTYVGHRDRNALRQELAQRLASADDLGRQSQLLALGAQRTVRELEVALAAVEARLGESQSQQLALEALYQDLARGRDEAALAEIEQSLIAANQQLVLAGNVKVALIALQSSDARLARIDRAQLAPLRRALARDIERLQGVPLVDAPGIALRLDRAVAAIDALTVGPVTQADAIDRSAPPSSGGSAADGSAPPAGSGWRAALARAFAEFKDEFRQLASIRRIDQDALPLIPPQQAWFLRENLRLRLLSARIALLARDQPGFRGDVSAARLWIGRYFDARDTSVSALAETLRELERAEIRIELPDIGASIEAVRVLRASRDRRQ